MTDTVDKVDKKVAKKSENKLWWVILVIKKSV